MIIIPNNLSSLEFTSDFRLDKYNLNDRLHQLYSNDSHIVNEIEASVITSKLTADHFYKINNTPTIFTDNVTALYDVVLTGSHAVIEVENLRIKDSYLSLNNSSNPGALATAGLGLLTSTISGSETQSLLYDLVADSWLFSGSGIDFGASLLVASMIAPATNQDTINLIEYDFNTIKDETASTVWARRYESGNVNLYSKSPSNDIKKLRTLKEEFTHIIYSQKDVDALYGSNLQGVSGNTVLGLPYTTELGSYVVQQNSNYAVLFDYGDYHLRYKIKLINGKIKGKHRAYTTITSTKGIVIENSTNAEIQNIGFSNCSGEYLIQLDNSRKCKVDIKAENNDISYVIDSIGSIGNTFNCLMENNSAICFHGSDRDFYKGVYNNNTRTFSSCIGMAQIFEDDNLIFGGI